MSKEEDDALDAGFNETELEEIAVIDEEIKEDLTGEPAELEGELDGQEAEEQDSGGQEDEEIVTPEMIGGMTVDEFNSVISKAREVDDLKSTVAKLRDTMHGRLGGIEQQVKSMPKSQIDRISPNAKKKLGDEFPELAEIFFGDVPDELPPENTQERERVFIPPSPVVDDRPEELTIDQKLELRLIQRDHKDWAQVLAQDDFRQFLEKKPRDEQDKFNSTWDADIVSGTITEFKNWKIDGESKTAAEKKASAEKAKRIKSAITPRGDGIPLGHDMDDEEAAMMQGFST